jgi:putative transposase
MPWKASEPMDQRRKFCWESLERDNFRQLCREYGISPKTGYKWKARFMSQGVEGMAEKSRRPKSHPQKLSEEEICRIVKLKELHKRWGPEKIRYLYQKAHGQAPSESSFKRILERCGLTQKRRKRRPSDQAGRLHSGRLAKAPNEVWTVDFKGWWRGGINQRCEPLTVRDEYSRYVLELRNLADTKTESVQGCFERLFERYGMPQAIRSDNGAPFGSVSAPYGLTRLSAWWLAMGIDLERGGPAHPQDNGAHERFHLDISLEIEADGISDQDSLDVWREEFNYKRPHQALGMKLPGEIYSHSERRYHTGLGELEYPQMASRRVSHTGTIRYQSHCYFLSGSLAGWPVGLKACTEARVPTLQVWFAKLLLGWLDLENLHFSRADVTPKPNEESEKE